MLVYFERFNTTQIAHACLRRTFQCGHVYLHFTYNDTYICYMHSTHLISIIKCHHHHPQWQCLLTTTLRFQQQFVLDKSPLPMNLIRFSSHPCLLLQYLHSIIPMDKVVEFVNQLTFFQCVIEELG